MKFSGCMQLSVGRIPYLNTEPFFDEDEMRANAVVAAPRRMLELALDGRVDLAPLPAVAAFDHPDMFASAGDLGIAAKAAAQSVLLIARVAPEDLNGRRIGVIGETATSSRLLKVLLRLRFGVTTARFEPLSADADAQLLIGDRALDRKPAPGFEHVLDLAAEWRAWTGLPFVFAFWMARRGVPREPVAQAMDYFAAALDRNLAAPERLHSRRAELGLTPAEVAAYLRAITYRFNDHVWAGLQHFRELDSRVNAEESAA